MSKPSFLLTTCGSHVELDMTAGFSLVHIISGVNCAASCIFCAIAFRSRDASQALCSVIDLALQMLAYQLVGVDALQVL